MTESEFSLLLNVVQVVALAFISARAHVSAKQLEQNAATLDNIKKGGNGNG